MTKVLLCPRSRYLASRWWHRLATVIFWAWFVFVLGYCWNAGIVEPWSSCINTKAQSKIVLGRPSDLDCGASAVSYFMQNAKGSSPSEIGFGLIFVVAALDVALATPGLLYRLVLYIAKGRTWRDAKNNA